MSKTIAELKATPTDQLIKEHDVLAQSTAVGVSYYLEELRSRENERIASAMEKFTRWIFWLTFVVTGSTLIQLALLGWPFFQH